MLLETTSTWGSAMPKAENRLVMTPHEMRRVGYATVDAVVEYLTDQRSRPVSSVLIVRRARAFSQRVGRRLRRDMPPRG